MQSTQRIFLVGPMGAGKSTVGRVLAQLMHAEFIDSDGEIERRTGADIPWIFEIEGEDGFRTRESQVIAELCSRSGVVVATGGGAVMREENRRLMTATGFVVYLKATVREQVRRTAKDSKRPLLAGKNRSQVLSDLFALRDPLYSDVADLTLPTAGKNARQLAESIAAAVELQPV
ncbi:MAG: Shikimate kinase protein [Pseudomonadota bacterium]